MARATAAALLVAASLSGARPAGAGGLSNGAACAGPGVCQSGICVDGVCCDALCNGGPCTVCSKARGASADGACTVLPDGTACQGGEPCASAAACTAGACVTTALVSCHTDAPCLQAVCNPLDGGCTTQPSAEGAPCDDGTGCTTGGACTGDGSCAGVPIDCPPADPCHDAGVCVPGYGCDLTPAPWCGEAPPPAQASTLSDGALCGVDGDCTSGHCVSGVCCDAPCPGPCRSCAIPGSLGTCGPEPRGVDLQHDCAPAGTCISTCDGDGGCIKADTGFACYPAECVSDHAGIAEATCQAGVCEVGGRTPFECSPYLCAAALGACAAETCRTVHDCAPGYACDATGHCQAPPDRAFGDDGGCGCRAALGSPDALLAGVACGALGVVLALSRRRRRQEGEP